MTESVKISISVIVALLTYIVVVEYWFIKIKGPKLNSIAMTFVSLSKVMLSGAIILIPINQFLWESEFIIGSVLSNIVMKFLLIGLPFVIVLTIVWVVWRKQKNKPAPLWSE